MGQHPVGRLNHIKSRILAWNIFPQFKTFADGFPFLPFEAVKIDI
jgi:hypothetical protein